MKVAAIKQVLKTLQQFKTSAILHEYQNFSLHYCGHTDSFIVTNSQTQEVKEFTDLDICASALVGLIKEPDEMLKDMKVSTD